MKTLCALTLFLLISLSGCASWKDEPRARIDMAKWRQWVLNLRSEAIAQGIRPSVFDRVFAKVTPQPVLLVKQRSYVKAKPNYYLYRLQRGDAIRIRLGRQEYIQHRQLLDKIGQQYGVEPCYLLAIWGIETVYGRNTGNHSVIASLATLAYGQYRSDYFRQELLYALKMINDGYVTEDSFIGSWDGGMGNPQFMPSSWYKYAVDYDGKGRKDIWRSHGDTLASMANYLRHFGWQAQQPYSVEVILPPHINSNLLAAAVNHTVSEWQALGIKIKPGQAKPNPKLVASLKQLDGGPAILIFNNFKAMLHYNRSPLYAGTVGYLAEQICHKPL
jgi:membrane-bound lytic murein transglycosylase B